MATLIAPGPLAAIPQSDQRTDAPDAPRPIVQRTPLGHTCRDLHGPDSVAPQPQSVALALWFSILVRQVRGVTGAALYVGEVRGPREEVLFRTRPLPGYGAAWRLAETHVAARVDQLLYRFVGSEQHSALYF